MAECKQRREKTHLKSKLWAQRGSGLRSAPTNANKTLPLFLICSNPGPLRSFFITRFGSEFTLAALYGVASNTEKQEVSQ